MDYAALAMALETNMARMRVRPRKNKVSDLSQGGEMFTLGVIAHFDEAISPGELSAECGVSTARIATTLNALENKGYIIRATDKADRRRTLVTITESGRSVSQQHDAKHRKTLEMMLRELGDRDADEYVRLVGRVAEIMGHFKPPEDDR